MTKNKNLKIVVAVSALIAICLTACGEKQPAPATSPSEAAKPATAPAVLESKAVGRLELGDAKSKCKALGMQIATQEQLVQLAASGTVKAATTEDAEFHISKPGGGAGIYDIKEKAALQGSPGMQANTICVK